MNIEDIVSKLNELSELVNNNNNIDNNSQFTSESTCNENEFIDLQAFKITESGIISLKHYELIKNSEKEKKYYFWHNGGGYLRKNKWTDFNSIQVLY